MKCVDMSQSACVVWMRATGSVLGRMVKVSGGGRRVMQLCMRR
jgi:hypothetical protein